METFQSYLQNEDELLSTIIVGEEAVRNHLNLQQWLFRQALKKSFQNVKMGTPTEGCYWISFFRDFQKLVQQAFTSDHTFIGGLRPAHLRSFPALI